MKLIFRDKKELITKKFHINFSMNTIFPLQVKILHMNMSLANLKKNKFFIQYDLVVSDF